MREFEIKPGLLKILSKLAKKDRTSYESLMSKIKEVINSENIEHYKNLSYSLKEFVYK